MYLKHVIQCRYTILVGNARYHQMLSDLMSQLIFDDNGKIMVMIGTLLYIFG